MAPHLWVGCRGSWSSVGGNVPSLNSGSWVSLQVCASLHPAHCIVRLSATDTLSKRDRSESQVPRARLPSVFQTFTAPCQGSVVKHSGMTRLPAPSGRLLCQQMPNTSHSHFPLLYLYSLVWDLSYLMNDSGGFVLCKLRWPVNFSCVSVVVFDIAAILNDDERHKRLMSAWKMYFIYNASKT